MPSSSLGPSTELCDYAGPLGLHGAGIVAALAGPAAIASRFGPENLRPIARWLGCCAHLRPKAREKPEKSALDTENGQA
jgi:hypothetical protein